VECGNYFLISSEKIREQTTRDCDALGLRRFRMKWRNMFALLYGPHQAGDVRANGHFVVVRELHLQCVAHSTKRALSEVLFENIKTTTPETSRSVKLVIQFDFPVGLDKSLVKLPTPCIDIGTRH
jgi:hypothetical protein